MCVIFALRSLLSNGLGRLFSRLSCFALVISGPSVAGWGVGVIFVAEGLTVTYSWWRLRCPTVFCGELFHWYFTFHAYSSFIAYFMIKILSWVRSFPVCDTFLCLILCLVRFSLVSDTSLCQILACVWYYHVA